MSLYGYLKNNKFDKPIMPNLGIGDHPNEYGHQVIAELLYNDIKEKGII